MQLCKHLQALQLYKAQANYVFVTEDCTTPEHLC